MLGTEVTGQTIYISGRDLEPGSYQLEISAYTLTWDYQENSSSFLFTITGKKPEAPEVTVDRKEIPENGSFTWSMQTENVDLIFVKEQSHSSI